MVVYITVEKEVEERNPKSVLAVDLGIRWIATTVNSNNPNRNSTAKSLDTLEDTTSTLEGL